MKHKMNVEAFASAVKAKVERAEALGTKTTWDTDDHLKALAKSVAMATDPEHDDAYVESILEVLRDGYNVSQFAQMLAKVPAYAAKGHFQRGQRGPTSANEMYKALGLAQ